MAAAASSSAISNRTEILLSLPNPFTPLAFLPPEIAWLVGLTSYSVVGSLSVLIWDILANLHNDYILLTRYLNLSVAVYCISRIFCLAYMLGLAIVATAPIGDCSWTRRIHSFYMITTASTCLLFFVRVRALYYNNKSVVAFFFILWLGVLGVCLTPALGIRAVNIGITDYCINKAPPSYVAFSAIIPVFYDTCIFVATTYALLQNSHVQGVQQTFKVVFFGKYLPAFSKAILHDGQVYYLTTLGLGLATCVVFINGAHVVLTLIATPNVVIANNLTCLVYRKVRFGDFRERAANPTITTWSANRENTSGGGTWTLSFFHSNQESSSATRSIVTTREEEAHNDEAKSDDLELQRAQDKHDAIV